MWQNYKLILKNICLGRFFRNCRSEDTLFLSARQPLKRPLLNGTDKAVRAVGFMDQTTVVADKTEAGSDG